MYRIVYAENWDFVFYTWCTLEIFAIRQLKKLKLVFKNAAKVIDPVVILFSADKEISGSLSVCVGWCCRGYLSISLYL